MQLKSRNTTHSISWSSPYRMFGLSAPQMLCEYFEKYLKFPPLSLINIADKNGWWNVTTRKINASRRKKICHINLDYYNTIFSPEITFVYMLGISKYPIFYWLYTLLITIFFYWDTLYYTFCWKNIPHRENSYYLLQFFKLSENSILLIAFNPNSFLK